MPRRPCHVVQIPAKKASNVEDGIDAKGLAFETLVGVAPPVDFVDRPTASSQRWSLYLARSVHPDIQGLQRRGSRPGIG